MTPKTPQRTPAEWRALAAQFRALDAINPNLSDTLRFRDGRVVVMEKVHLVAAEMCEREALALEAQARHGDN